MEVMETKGFLENLLKILAKLKVSRSLTFFVRIEKHLTFPSETFGFHGWSHEELVYLPSET